MHAFFIQYCNLPHIPSRDLDYLQYLEKFNSFFYLSEKCKKSKQYSAYVRALWDYLLGFFMRIHPLVNITPLLSEWMMEFENKWINNKLVGWHGIQGKESVHESQPLRLGMFNSVEELEALGANRLKEALYAMNLKCGGTVSEKANRLWSVRGKKPEDIPEKLLLKKRAELLSDSSASSHREVRVYSEYLCVQIKTKSQTAWQEFCCGKICDLLIDVLVATRKHAEKQHLRTIEEKEAELREEEFGLLPDVDTQEEEHNDEEGPLYNPLNLPLGWDGKPIPFWLYKLHGLGIEYKCEICGNQSYWGRRAFDKHFQEWRHAQGMRCLGIPNTKHFHDITLIADALALYNKIKSSLKQEAFQGELDEEFEDSDGNVLNRRTYEDLARQGLL